MERCFKTILKANNAEKLWLAIEGKDPNGSWEAILFEKIIPWPAHIKASYYEPEFPLQPGVGEAHEWCLTHWGTRWVPCYTHREADTAISFATEDAHPYPLIEELSRKFPGLTLEVMIGEVSIADENLGSDAERYIIRDGQRLTNQSEDSDPVPLYHMNRKLKFRAWDAHSRCMAPVLRLDYNTDFPEILDSVDLYPGVVPILGYTGESARALILMQDTGFRDNNGVEIYEGDIVQGDDKYEVVVKDACFWLYNLELERNDPALLQEMHRLASRFRDDFAVIGNCFEHPELLKPNSTGR